MNQIVVENAWLLRLIPLLPAVGAAILGLSWMFGARYRKDTIGWISCAGPFLAFVISVLGFLSLVAIEHGSDRRITDTLWEWFRIGPITIPMAFELDPLSAVMTLVVTGIGFLIHVYSTAYMGEDPGFQKFMSYLNLFTAAMLVLVLGNNFLVMFIGWEGVGLCSYLLIGFWYSDTANANAAKKAFVVNRVGDFSFVVGLAALVWGVGKETGFYSVVFSEMAANWTKYAEVQANPAAAILGIPLITFATLCFFGGATGKSAQIPLYVWLPDAMAGPTPVSALIHAATMVTSGIYMITRLNFLYSLAPETLLVVAIVGAATALIAASIGLFQYDIKKVLAYSTVSQLGYMFVGLGAAAYTAGMFHVFTHAFFKACLFLGSGSVIHALHHALPHGVDAQDMRNMGGLKRYMPVTHWTFGVSVIAIAGIFPFAGFWSKDEILWKSFERFYNGEPYGAVYLALYFVGLAGAAMTAFYMTRQYVMTFLGEYRGKKAGEAYLAAHGAHHADGGHGTHAVHDDAHGDAAHGGGHAHDEHEDEHADHGAVHDPEESPFAITFPLRALALGSIAAGFLGLAAWTAPVTKLVGLEHPNVWHTWLSPVIVDTKGGAAEHHAEAGLLAAKAAEKKPDTHGGHTATDAAHPDPKAHSKEKGADDHGGGEHHGGGHHAPAWLEILLALFSVGIAASSMFLAYTWYQKTPEVPARRLAAYGPGGALSGTFPGKLYRWIYNKYYVDEAYQVAFVDGSKRLSRFSGKFDAGVVDGFVNFLGYVVLVVRWIVGLFDKHVIDGIFVNWIVAGLVGKAGAFVRKAQTGDLQVYLRWVAYGALATASAYFLIITTSMQAKGK